MTTRRSGIAFWIGAAAFLAIVFVMTQVVRNARDGFLPRIAREKKRDLVRHVDHLLGLHHFSATASV